MQSKMNTTLAVEIPQKPGTIRTESPLTKKKSPCPCHITDTTFKDHYACAAFLM